MGPRPFQPKNAPEYYLPLAPLVLSSSENARKTVAGLGMRRRHAVTVLGYDSKVVEVAVVLAKRVSFSSPSLGAVRTGLIEDGRQAHWISRDVTKESSGSAYASGRGFVLSHSCEPVSNREQGLMQVAESWPPSMLLESRRLLDRKNQVSPRDWPTGPLL